MPKTTTKATQPKNKRTRVKTPSPDLRPIKRELRELHAMVALIQASIESLTEELITRNARVNELETVLDQASGEA